MPYGMGQVVRQALITATPWQRYLIAVAMIAGGVGLALVGHVAGAVLAAAGVLLLVRMLRLRLARRHRGAGSRAPGGPTWDHSGHDRADQP